VTAGLAAAIQNRLFWRACEKVSGAISFLRRWYRDFPGYHSTVCDARKAARTPEETAISASGLIHRENAALAG
jgi:hypothetical protein